MSISKRDWYRLRDGTDLMEAGELHNSVVKYCEVATTSPDRPNSMRRREGANPMAADFSDNMNTFEPRVSARGFAVPEKGELT